MDYSQMSDLEIDALVAERVCGWGGFGESIGHGIVGLAPDGLVHELPHFSTDANAALDAVKKCVNGVTLGYFEFVRDGDSWKCLVAAVGVKGRAECPAPARAICEALLAATEPH